MTKIQYTIYSLVCIFEYIFVYTDFPGGSVVKKNRPANAGDTGSIPGSRRPSVGRNGSPLQYSCLGNPMDRGAWRATVHGVAESHQQQQYTHTHTHTYSSNGKQLVLVFNFLKIPLWKNHEEDTLANRTKNINQTVHTYKA